VAVGGFDAVLTGAGRAVIAGAIALVVLRVHRVPRPERSLLRPLLFTMAGAVFGWPILLALALQRTTSAHAAVIAACVPLVTAVLAVSRAGERVARQFWFAAGLGALAVVGFSLARGGAQSGDLIADLLVLGAALASSWCYVEGAVLTRVMPGWQVISWVVVLALPITVPMSLGIWLATRANFDTTPTQWGALVLLGLFPMYLGFFAWYRGLGEAGIAHGAQVQQLQVLLTLLWSALLLGEQVTWGMVLTALVIIAAVAWAQRTRIPTVVTPED
jgi:drug/metabolite transporter (DMT)-like permease